MYQQRIVNSQRRAKNKKDDNDDDDEDRDEKKECGGTDIVGDDDGVAVQALRESRVVRDDSQLRTSSLNLFRTRAHLTRLTVDE